MRQHKRISITVLPGDVLEKIATYLSANQTSQLANTCKQLETVQEDELNQIREDIKNNTDITSNIEKQSQIIKYAHCTEKLSGIATFIDNQLARLKEKQVNLFKCLSTSTKSDPAKYKEILALITSNPLLIFAKDENGFTPLHWAACTGDTEVVKLLLANRANVDKTRNVGATPLHGAACHGYTEIVTTLIAAGADVNATVTEGPFKGFTPLHWAAGNGRKDMVEVLLHAGADVTAIDKDRNTPLHLALMKTPLNWDIIDLLFKQVSDTDFYTGPHQEQENNKLETPLYLATSATGENKPLIEQYIRARNERDTKRAFPRHTISIETELMTLFIEKGWLDIVKIMLDHEQTIVRAYKRLRGPKDLTDYPQERLNTMYKTLTYFQKPFRELYLKSLLSKKSPSGQSLTRIKSIKQIIRKLEELQRQISPTQTRPQKASVPKTSPNIRTKGPKINFVKKK